MASFPTLSTNEKLTGRPDQIDLTFDDKCLKHYEEGAANVDWFDLSFDNGPYLHLLEPIVRRIKYEKIDQKLDLSKALNGEDTVPYGHVQTPLYSGNVKAQLGVQVNGRKTIAHSDIILDVLPALDTKIGGFFYRDACYTPTAIEVKRFTIQLYVRPDQLLEMFFGNLVSVQMLTRGCVICTSHPLPGVSYRTVST